MPRCEKFSDRFDREWEVCIDVPAMKRIKDATGVNILDMTELGQIGNDPVKFVEVIYAAVNPEAKGITPEDFAKGFTGDSLESASDALVNSILAFLPKKKADQLRQMIDAGKAFLDAHLKVVEHVFAPGGEWEKQLQDRTDALLSELSKGFQPSAPAVGTDGERFGVGVVTA